MTRIDLVLVLAVALVAMGTTSVLLTSDLIRRIVALNVASAGVMMLFLGLAYRTDPAHPDPVPHALVLTGIVIMVAVTGLGLALIRRIESSEGDEPAGGNPAADKPANGNPADDEPAQEAPRAGEP